MKELKYKFIGKKVEWEVVGEDNCYYATNDNGKGVFKVCGSERTQKLGTVQFSVAGLTKSSAREKIRKYMEHIWYTDASWEMEE